MGKVGASLSKGADDRQAGGVRKFQVDKRTVGHLDLRCAKVREPRDVVNGNVGSDRSQVLLRQQSIRPAVFQQQDSQRCQRVTGRLFDASD